MRFLTPEETLGRAETLRVEPRRIHVWPVLLAGTESSRTLCTESLDFGERERAARFHYERDRAAFIFAHGQLRHLLARYCGADPSTLRFRSGEYGKPELASEQSFASHLSFNLTHSAGRAVVVVSDGGEIGADVECHDRSNDVMALAERYFFGSEFDAIRDAPEGQRSRMFFRFWTAKEAVLKAQGGGSRFHSTRSASRGPRCRARWPWRLSMCPASVSDGTCAPCRASRVGAARWQRVRMRGSSASWASRDPARATWSPCHR